MSSLYDDTPTMRKLRVSQNPLNASEPTSPTAAESSLHDSVDIAYRVVGSGREKIVFISGMCVSHQMWQRQIQYFQMNPLYTLLLIDNRGSGDSSTPTMRPGQQNNSNFNSPYSVYTLAQDVWYLVNHVFGPHSVVHLVGHSMGSMIAQRAAIIASPLSRVASLTLLCGHDGGWFWNYVPSMNLLRALIEFANARGDIRRIADIFLRLHFTCEYLDAPTLCEHSGAKIPYRDVLMKRYTLGMLHDYKQYSNQCDQQNIEEKNYGMSPVLWNHMHTVRSHHLTEFDAHTIRQMKIPKLVVYGRQDSVVLPRASRQLAGRINAQCVSVQAAHFAMEEAAADINELIAMQILRARSTPSTPEHDNGFLSSHGTT